MAKKRTEGHRRWYDILKHYFKISATFRWCFRISEAIFLHFSRVTACEVWLSYKSYLVRNMIFPVKQSVTRSLKILSVAKWTCFRVIHSVLLIEFTFFRCWIFFHVLLGSAFRELYCTYHFKANKLINILKTSELFYIFFLGGGILPKG